MKHSCANVFCSRSGARSGPVKNGDRTRCESTRSLRDDTRAALQFATRPAMYDGAVFEPLLSGCVGAGAGVRGVNGGRARSRASVPVTSCPGVLSPGRPPFAADQAS